MAKVRATTPAPQLKTDDKINDKITELENQLKRALADYQNLEKRFAQEKTAFIKFACANLISNLIPSLEILEKAAFHSQDIGVKMALEEFRQALFSEGLEEIAPNEGDVFDPNLEECSEVVVGEKNDTIAQLVAKGYRFKDGGIIKPAKVKVYKSQNTQKSSN